jgi:histidine triad (HIT) family protein
MDRFASPAAEAAAKASKPCPFCAITAGKGAADLVAEDAETIAFLDHSPLLKGHVLLIPRAHVATLPDADDATLQALARRLRNLAAALPRALGADGTFVAENNIVSQSVAHLHFHVVPRWRGDRLFSHNLSWRRLRYAAGEAERIAAAIRAALETE